MIGLSLVLAAQASFSFGGGSASELAAKLESTFRKPAVVLSNRTEQFRSVATSYETQSELLKIITGHLRIRVNRSLMPDLTSAEFLSASPKQWPVDLYYRGYGRTDWDTLDRIAWQPAPGIREAKIISLVVPKLGFATMESVRAALITDDGFSVVQWHWFFDKVEMGISCSEVDRPLLARAVAEAIGAKLIADKQTILFELDPSAMRERVIAMKDHDPKIELFSPARRTLDAHAYESMTDEQISAVWRDRNSGLTLDVPDEGTRRSLVDARLNEIASGSGSHAWKDAARRSIGKPAKLQVSTLGVFVHVRQPDGGTYSF